MPDETQQLSDAYTRLGQLAGRMSLYTPTTMAEVLRLIAGAAEGLQERLESEAGKHRLGMPGVMHDIHGAWQEVRQDVVTAAVKAVLVAGRVGWLQPRERDAMSKIFRGLDQSLDNVMALTHQIEVTYRQNSEE